MTLVWQCFAAGPVGRDMEQTVRLACLNNTQPKGEAPLSSQNGSRMREGRRCLEGCGVAAAA